MKPKDGRKALVVFSDGADRGSKETLNDAIDAADHANVAVYTIYFKGEQERGWQRLSRRRTPWRHGRRRLSRRRRRLSRRWRRLSRRRGAARRRRRAQPAVDGKKIMEQIATRTGGRFFEAKKKDNLEEIYSQIAEELRGQYLLTYTPDKVDNEGGFHKIALKAKNGDLTVVTREGYYAGGEVKRPACAQSDPKREPKTARAQPAGCAPVVLTHPPASWCVNVAAGLLFFQSRLRRRQPCRQQSGRASRRRS